MGRVKEYYHDEIEKAMRETRRFRANNQSDKLNGARIDAEKGIIYGMSACSEGEALGHYVWLDSAFIGDVTKLGKAIKVGIKSRFGHPSMSGESLGTFIGRCKNFRVEDTKSICDLYFDDSSEVTPSGNLKEYLLKLAETSPDMFGASIVFSVGSYFYKKTTGENISTSEHYDNQDKGKVDYNLEVDDYGNTKYYVTIKELHGVDLVDEPAANAEGLFSQFSSTVLHGDKFAVIATQFLNSNPKIAEFLQENPHKINEFMKKFNEGKVGDATPEVTPVAETKPTVKPVAETKPVETDGDGEDAAKGDESLLSKFGAMLDDKLGKMETKFQTALDGIEKRVKDMEEDPNATPTFSSPKADKQPEVVKPKKSWDVEYEKRHGGMS
jgi:hypothetical protein